MLCKNLWEPFLPLKVLFSALKGKVTQLLGKHRSGCCGTTLCMEQGAVLHSYLEATLQNIAAAGCAAVRWMG